MYNSLLDRIKYFEIAVKLGLDVAHLALGMIHEKENKLELAIQCYQSPMITMPLLSRQIKIDELTGALLDDEYQHD